MRARTLLAAALLAPLLLGACSGGDQRGSQAQRMEAWVRTTTFGERAGQLRGTADAVAQLAAKPMTSTVLATRCAVLLVDVQADNGDLPSPNQRVTDILAQAYTAYAKAGIACAKEAKAGADHPSAEVLSGLAWATTQLLQALNRIELISGRAVATSTTVPPAA